MSRRGDGQAPREAHVVTSHSPPHTVRRCPMKRLIPLLALAVLAACASANRYARWPYRGPMLMVTTPTHSRLTVMARDGMGRELVTATIKPNGKQCFRWPFIHAIGYLIAAGGGPLPTEAFGAWGADGWGGAGRVKPG